MLLAAVVLLALVVLVVVPLLSVVEEVLAVLHSIVSDAWRDVLEERY